MLESQLIAYSNSVLKLSHLANIIVQFFRNDRFSNLEDRISEFKQVICFRYHIESAGFYQFIRSKILINSDNSQNLKGKPVRIEKKIVKYDYQNYYAINLIHIILQHYRNNRAAEFLFKYVESITEIEPTMLGGISLHLIVRYQSAVDCLDCLFTYKNLNVNAKDNKDNTPLHVAIVISNNGAVEKLLEHPNIDIDALNIKGYTPLHLAMMNKNFHAAECILNFRKAEIYPISGTNLVLFKLALKQNNNIILSLLLNHPSFKLKLLNNEIGTLLRIAICQNNIDAIKLLLKFDDLNVNAMNEFGISSLCLAVYVKNLKIIKLLLSHEKIDVNAKYSKNASTNSHLKKLSIFQALNALPLSSDVLELRGLTPLHCTLCQYNFNTTLFLIKNGARFDIQDDTGRTPLDIFFKDTSNVNKKVEISKVNLLLQIIAKYPECINDFENIVFLFQQILKQGYKTKLTSHIIKYMLKCSNKIEFQIHNFANENLQVWHNTIEPMILHALCKIEFVKEKWLLDTLKYFLKKAKNVRIDDRDFKGLTAMQHAVKYQNLKFLNILILYGAEVNIMLCSEFTGLKIPLLHEACYASKQKLISYMLENGAEVDIKDDMDQTALQIVVKEYLKFRNESNNHDFENLERILIIQELILYHANPNVRISNEIPNILFYACAHEDYVLVKFLLQSHLINLNYRSSSSNGNTPLHISCINGNLNIIRMLLKSGADLLVCNCDNQSALDLFYGLKERLKNSGETLRLKVLVRIEQLYITEVAQETKLV